MGTINTIGNRKYPKPQNLKPYGFLILTSTTNSGNSMRRSRKSQCQFARPQTSSYTQRVSSHSLTVDHHFSQILANLQLWFHDTKRTHPPNPWLWIIVSHRCRLAGFRFQHICCSFVAVVISNCDYSTSSCVLGRRRERIFFPVLNIHPRQYTFHRWPSTLCEVKRAPQRLL